MTEQDRAIKAAYMRQYRLDPARREKEYERNRRYSKAHRDIINPIKTKYRQSRSGDPQYMAQQAKNVRSTYQRLRDKIFSAYGNKCACCGETERDFFEIDHVHGGGAKHFHSHSSPTGVYREIVRAGFPADYRILCANCNRGRQRNGGVCPHEQAQKPTRVPFFLHSYRINQEVHA